MPPEDIPPMPGPFFVKVPVCAETRAKRTRAYEYQTPCFKCGKKLTERNAWEGMKWKVVTNEDGVPDLVLVTHLFCAGCARRAISFYKKKS
ncbi:MAG: hypothetical protein GY769_08030 [bacterium]|nr:hypothetical protein [bacterium]